MDDRFEALSPVRKSKVAPLSPTALKMVRPVTLDTPISGPVRKFNIDGCMYAEFELMRTRILDMPDTMIFHWCNMGALCTFKNRCRFAHPRTHARTDETNDRFEALRPAH